MEKEKPFKLFVPPRLSGGQVSAVKPQTSKLIFKFVQGFNKCPDDDSNLPFVMMSTSNRGEITDSGKSKISIYLTHSLKFFNTVNIFHE
uniref:Uncharacterized protein n=1 Tax=Accipiter nisus TaxID=211598 RepID=A0A8B9RV94_9AVES